MSTQGTYVLCKVRLVARDTNAYRKVKWVVTRDSWRNRSAVESTDSDGGDTGGLRKAQRPYVRLLDICARREDARYCLNEGRDDAGV